MRNLDKPCYLKFLSKATCYLIMESENKDNECANQVVTGEIDKALLEHSGCKWNMILGEHNLDSLDVKKWKKKEEKCLNVYTFLHLYTSPKCVSSRSYAH